MATKERERGETNSPKIYTCNTSPTIFVQDQLTCTLMSYSTMV